MNQPAAKGGNNGQALGYAGGGISNLPGITVSNGHVTEIKWNNKDLAGTLDLSGFPALQKVDISGNKISSLSVSGTPALIELNASKTVLQVLHSKVASNYKCFDSTETVLPRLILQGFHS